MEWIFKLFVGLMLAITVFIWIGYKAKVQAFSSGERYFQNKNLNVISYFLLVFFIVPFGIYIFTDWLNGWALNLHVGFRFMGFFIFELGMVVLHLSNEGLTRTYKDVIDRFQFKTESQKSTIYHYIRYPIYTALFMMIAGGAMLTGLLFCGVPTFMFVLIICTSHVIKLDKALAKTYKSDFSYYKAQTGWLLPKFWKW